MIKLAGLDSGSKRDFTALVSIQVFPEKQKIFVDWAYRWKNNTNYADIQGEVAAMCKKAQWSKIAVEVNGVGLAQYDGLRRKGLPVVPVTTTGKLSDVRKINDPEKMQKPAMAALLRLYRKKHVLQYARNSSNPHIKELIRQDELFREFVTPAGNTQYRASGRNDHDDLTMAQLLALHLGKRFIYSGTPKHFVKKLEIKKRILECGIYA